MKRIQGLLLAGLLPAAVTLRPAEAREDWRYMSQWVAAHQISEETSVSLLAEAYSRDDFTDIYNYDGYLTGTRQLGAGFTLIGQMFLARTKSETGEWTDAASAVAGALHTTDIPHVGLLRLQERVYYRLDSPDGWDHHRPRVYLCREFGDWTLLVSDEMRLDLGGDRARSFFRNRLFATATWKATDALSIGLGYFRNWDREDDGGWCAWNGVQSVVTVRL